MELTHQVKMRISARQKIYLLRQAERQKTTASSVLRKILNEKINNEKSQF